MQTAISSEGRGGTNGPEERKPPRPVGWKRLASALLAGPSAYRPERHYMRGPGPKWRERHPVSMWEHDPSNIA